MANFKVMGKDRKMAVDSVMPFYNSYSSLLFSKADNNAAWVPVMEKIWAKLNGNYDNIVCGDSSEAVNFMTGVMSFSYSLSYPSEEDINALATWDTLYDALVTNNYIVTISVGSCPDGTSVYGLVCSHAYSLLDLVILYDNGVATQHLYKIRNPWKKDHLYNATFHDSDPIWDQGSPQTYREQVGHIEASDGITWVRREELHNMFSRFQIGHYRQGYQFSLVEVNDDQAGEAKEFTFTLT